MAINWTILKLDGGSAEKIAEHFGRRWYRVYVPNGMFSDQEIGEAQGVKEAQRMIDAHYAPIQAEV